jgi:RimJ/RimL family protein N-acetyltransferase
MSFHVDNGTIETDRLILRQPAASDVDALATLFADAEVMRSYGTGQPLDRAKTIESLERVAEHYKTYGFGAQIALEKATGMLIGLGGLQRGNPTLSEEVQIGGVLAKRVWNLGYAIEGGIAVLEYGLTVLGLKRIEAITPASNAAAIAVIKKLRMPFDGNLTHDGIEYVRFAVTNEVPKGPTQL